MFNYVTPPLLDNDTTRPPLENERVARFVVANLIHFLDQKGFVVYRVFDGEQHEKTFNAKDAMEVIFSVEEARLHVRQPGQVGHTIVIAPVNGAECVVDHSEATNDWDGFGAAMGQFDDEFDAEQIHVVQPPTKETPMGNVKALIPVESSTIAAMGHDVVSNIMTVRFKNGTQYQYQDVPLDKFERILNAESVGKAFDKEIKKQAALHPFTKVA